MSLIKKRKHTTLSLSVKCEILNKFDEGMKVCDIAKIYGIGRSTIHDIRNQREKIESFLKTTENNSDFGKRKTLKRGEYPDVENALYTWFSEERKRVPITGEMLQEKAKTLYQKFTNKDDFKASNGWLDKFKKRFGIRLLATTTGEFRERKEEIICAVDLENLTPIDLVPHENAVIALETSIKWAAENGVSRHEIEILEKLRNRALGYAQAKAELENEIKNIINN